MKKKIAHPEDDMQRALFQWIALATPRIPQLRVAFHPANGGQRSKIEGARLKGLGVRPGVPDVVIPAKGLPIKSGMMFGMYDRPSAGLAIELKAGKNKPTPEQREWHERLRAEDWAVAVCYSFDEARQTIANYFGVKP